MKKLLLILVFSFSTILLFGLEISVETGSFKNETKSYLEAYIRVLGNTIEFQPLSENETLLQARVQITIVISQEDKIVAYEKYVLNSPTYTEPQDFLDVKRFALPAGEYTLKIDAADENNPDNKLSLEKKVEVHGYTEQITLSDIQLFAAVSPSDPSNPLAKNGLFMEPFSYGFVAEDVQVLNIYAEVYKNADVVTPHFVRYAIIEGYSEGVGEVSFQKFKKLAGKESEPLVLKLPIDKLPSGKYHVLVEIFDKDKVTIAARNSNFMRSNPEYDVEYWSTYNKDEDYSFVSDLSGTELNYALRAISAIVYEPKKSLMEYMIKDAPIRAQRKFLLEFWKEKAPRSPELSYQKFMEIAKIVDLEYNNNVGYGFETDRGYIFLRYGKPSNAIDVDTEPDSYPYEIWYYNYLKETNQTNVRFIFYNKSLAHNDYSLLHSTCIGERQFPAWETELYRRALDVQAQNSIDDNTTITDSWQRNARRYFNDF